MDFPARPPKAKAEEKKTLYVKFGDFLRKYRILVLAAFGASLLAVLGVAVGTAIKSRAVEASASRLEKLNEDYATYSSEQDAAKKAELEKTLVAYADEIVKKWPRQFAAQKARAYKAGIAEAKKDWESAEKDWLAIVAAAPGTYMAPVALRAAAVAAEERGAPDKAAEYYKKLVDTYSSKSVGIPHAYFSLGRLSEGSKDYPAAMESYQKLVSTWPDSDWTKLATDRIISLKARGLSK